MYSGRGDLYKERKRKWELHHSLHLPESPESKRIVKMKRSVSPDEDRIYPKSYRREHDNLPKRYKIPYKDDLNKSNRDKSPGYESSSSRGKLKRVELDKKRRSPDESRRGSYKSEIPPEAHTRSRQTEDVHEFKASKAKELSVKDSQESEFLEKLINIEPMTLLKVLYSRLDVMNFKELDELNLLSEIMIKARDLVFKSMPSEIERNVKKKLLDQEAELHARKSAEIPKRVDACVSSNRIKYISDGHSNPKNVQSPTHMLKSVIDSLNSSSSTQNMSSYQNTASFVNEGAIAQKSQGIPHQNQVWNMFNSNQSNQNNTINQNTRYEGAYPSSYNSSARPQGPQENYLFSRNEFNVSGIPGLTLASVDTPEQQKYNTIQNALSTIMPDTRKNSEHYNNFQGVPQPFYHMK